MRIGLSRWLVSLAALIGAALSIWSLERWRAGVEMTPLTAGATPATLYRQPGATGPLVVIAHGFAGSRQLMEAYSLTLARAGYAVAAFDFEGHGRNPQPMGGDVGDINGTTALLVAETRRVIGAAASVTEWAGPVALVGHSMATDIIIRAALADDRVGPVVAISGSSEAVTASAPDSLLLLAGEWEAGRRAIALEDVRLIDPAAAEGETVRAGPAMRRAVAAPLTEHVSVLYSAVALTEARDWLDAFYGRSAETPVARTGGWIAFLLVSLAALWWGVAALFPRTAAPKPIPRRTFLIAMIAPAAAAPLVATQINLPFLPVLVADYLAVHLFVFGVLQIAVLVISGVRLAAPRGLPLILLTLWCVAVFGAALDRYAVSFAPTGDRWLIMTAIVVGSAPFMVADAMATAGGAAPFWRRMALRVVFFLSLIAAVAIDVERLFFLVIILPVIVLFFLVFGVMGRWTALRAGDATAGVALGLSLAWALASTFPLFQP